VSLDDALARVRRRPGERPRVYAHRGASRHAPENTLRAFALGMDEGADGVELDVRTCGTGEVIVLHDPDFWRVAGDTTTVHALPLREVRARDVGGGEHVPLLDDAIDLVTARGGLVNVEVKGDAPEREPVVRALRATLARRPPRTHDACFLSTFDPLLFLMLRRALPATPCGFLFDTDNTRPVRARFARLALRPHGLHPEHVLASDGAIRRWRRRGAFVNVWTVDRPERAAALARAGADGIITNEPAAILAAVAASEAP
jgi:glycerophosphoryl diester phosphodiesterase